ncbi:MAG: S1 family peptidase, partial [Gammaproteobacteria bacterium]
MSSKFLLSALMSGFVSQAVAITGGTPVAAGAWPSVAAVSKNCTGTLIHPELVVYAAHCGTDIDFVAFGQDFEHPEKRVKVTSCKAYPNSRLKQGEDIAYCRLAEAQPFAIVAPLSGREAHFLKPSVAATIVGFGLNGNGKRGIKHEAVSAISCLTPHAEMFIGGDGVDSCSGDSGGPAFVRLGSDGAAQWRLAGIASYGSVCGAGGYYVRMDRALAWLESETGLALASPDSTHAPTEKMSSAFLETNAGVAVDDIPPRIDIVETVLNNEHQSPWIELQIKVEAEDPAGGCGLHM